MSPPWVDSPDAIRPRVRLVGDTAGAGLPVYRCVNTGKMVFMRLDRSAKVYVAGHRGLVGSALCRHLHEEGFINQVVRQPSLICAIGRRCGRSSQLSALAS